MNYENISFSDTSVCQTAQTDAQQLPENDDVEELSACKRGRCNAGRTPLWEEIYYEVEKETDEAIGRNAPRGMGFCFLYWSSKAAVLARRGIFWKSPHEMNPRVMFD